MKKDPYTMCSDPFLLKEDSLFKEEKNLELEDEVRKDDSEEEEGFVSQDTRIWRNVPWEWDEETATLTLQGGNAGTVATAS